MAIEKLEDRAAHFTAAKAQFDGRLRPYSRRYYQPRRGVNLGRTTRPTPCVACLENALVAQADFILLNEMPRHPDSRGMEFLTHPPWRNIMQPTGVCLSTIIFWSAPVRQRRAP